MLSELLENLLLPGFHKVLQFGQALIHNHICLALLLLPVVEVRAGVRFDLLEVFSQFRRQQLPEQFNSYFLLFGLHLARSVFDALLRDKGAAELFAEAREDSGIILTEKLIEAILTSEVMSRFGILSQGKCLSLLGLNSGTLHQAKFVSLSQFRLSTSLFLLVIMRIAISDHGLL